MVYLASVFKRKNNICSLKEISKKESISFDYLEKIISKLEKKGLVISKRGVKGGYFLARLPKKIKIGEIIKILEGTIAPVECLIKDKKERYKCPRQKTCKTFGIWKKIQDVLNSTFDSVTLEDLIK